MGRYHSGRAARRPASPLKGGNPAGMTISAGTCGLSEFAGWVRAEVADGPSGVVTRVLTGQAGAGRPAGGGEQVHPLAFAMPSFGQVQRDVAAAVPGEGSGTSIRSRRMW